MYLKILAKPFIASEFNLVNPTLLSFTIKEYEVCDRP